MSLALCSSLVIHHKIDSILLTETLIILSCILITLSLTWIFRFKFSQHRTAQQYLDILLILKLAKASVNSTFCEDILTAKFLIPLALTMPDIISLSTTCLELSKIRLLHLFWFLILHYFLSFSRYLLLNLYYFLPEVISVPT